MMKQLPYVLVLLVVTFFFLRSIVHASSSSFVTEQGRNLYLNGQLFRSVGVNKYNLMTTGGNPYIGCGGSFTNSELDTWFSELQQMGVTAVRFWAFQSFTKSGSDLERFNYLLSLSKRYEVKLIPVFENQWKECTQDGYKDSAWYQTGYVSPYGNYTLSLKDYIGRIVSLYKNNPQILMWQIMNEAESSDAGALYNFAKDVSGYIKSLDSNHLVSFGTMGSGQQNSQEYKEIHALSSIDVLEYHDYEAETVSLPIQLSNRVKDSIALDKPLFVGESGISLNKYSAQERAVYFTDKIDAYFQNGGSLYMVWSYRDANPIERSYNFNFTDPLTQVIKNHTASLNSQSSSVLAATVSPTLQSKSLKHTHCLHKRNHIHHAREA